MAAQKTPWAVLLCKFKDDTTSYSADDTAAIKDKFIALDKESALSFWRDASYGAVDVSESQAFDWITLDQKQGNYLGSGANQQGRQDLVTWAKDAATKAGIDLAPFYGVAIYMSTQTDLWGSPTQVVCDSDSPFAAILQEFGHGLGQIHHSRAVQGPVADYTDPFCVMSSMSFGQPTIVDKVLNHPFFAGDFGDTGPLMCAPYVDARGWLTTDRVITLATDGSRPKPIAIVRLAPLGSQLSGPPAQVATLDLVSPEKTKYYFEYRSGGWDRGMAQRQVVIHQFRPDQYAYYAGNIPVSVGVAGGVNLQPQRFWLDPTFDLCVRVTQWPTADNDSVEIVIAPKSAARLSVRTIAGEKLGLTGSINVRTQIPPPQTPSLARRLLTDLGS
jgi:hypothetical protein